MQGSHPFHVVFELKPPPLQTPDSQVAAQLGPPLSRNPAEISAV